MKKTITCFTVISMLLLTIASCNKQNECGYDVPKVVDSVDIVSGCGMTDSLNLSTGLDSIGRVIVPGKGVIDKFWRVLNNPPLTSHTSPLTVNGNAYVVAFNASFGIYNWAHLPNCSPIAPVDVGVQGTFGDNNATNSLGDAVPYVFERPFCVQKSTKVNLSFIARADDLANFELINNTTNTVVSSASGANLVSGIMNWNAPNLNLPAGSYSIRCYLINTNAIILGFSLKGGIKTVNGENAISNNYKGCCENNTISILNIYDENCNKKFDVVDAVAPGWVFTVKQGTNVIRTGTTDINGNVFFSGLPNGTYTVEKTPKPGFTSYNPSTATVTVNNNQVKILEFLHCK